MDIALRKERGVMRSFTFTVDDNIEFLKDLSSAEYADKGFFDHPYLAMYRRLHERFGAKIQLNLFYKTDGFDLSRMTERYRPDFEACSDWLKMSFHSRAEFPGKPYAEDSGDEMLRDLIDVEREILRFAGERSMTAATTIHYCRSTVEGTRMLGEHGVRGLMGLYGSDDAPRISYSIPAEAADRVRHGNVCEVEGIYHFPISLILNKHTIDEIPALLDKLNDHEFVGIMIHEQYFLPWFCRSEKVRFQPDFEQKLALSFDILLSQGRKFCFAEELCK